MNVDDAERAVLGAVLSGADLEVQLRPQDFHQPAHESVFAACQRVTATGRKPDPVSVRLALGDARLPNDAGVYLVELMESCPVLASVDFYAGLVADGADRRGLKDVALRVQQMADQSDRPSAELIEDARALLDGAPQRGVSDGSTWADLFPRVLDHIERGQDHGVPLPWPDLDAPVHGLQPGWVYLVAARPGMGKSVMGQGIALHVARQGRTAVFVSLEMSENDLGMRLVADMASIPLSHLIDNNLSQFEEVKIAEVHRTTADLPLVVFDTPNQSFAQIRSEVRNVTRKADVGVVVIDYLQLIQPRDPRVIREQQVAEISRSLKVMARELKVPVVALTQLNRGPEQRVDKQPLPSDLRESGSQEQDADVIFLAWRTTDEPWELKVHIGKNRWGPQPQVALDFHGHYSRLTSVGESAAASRSAS